MDPRGPPHLNVTIDASVFLSIYLHEIEGLALSFSELLADPAVSVKQPAIWVYEIANGLRTSERRGRTDEQYSRAVLSSLFDLSIAVENGTPLDTAADLLETARAFSLSGYDAAYIRFCQNHDCTLWTLDTKLRAAAHEAGVRTLGTT